MSRPPDSSGGNVVPEIWIDQMIAPGAFAVPDATLFFHGDPVRLTRRQRVRRWRRTLILDAREWVALKFAPWLDRDEFL
jgi:hypothetical protein